MAWSRDFVTRRIDRCYLVATWTRVAAKRRRYLALARQYRALLAAMPSEALHPFTGRAIPA